MSRKGKLFREIMANTEAPYFKMGRVDFINVICAVLQTCISNNISSNFIDYMYNTETYTATKTISERYLQVRCQCSEKQMTAVFNRGRIRSRQIYTKLIHFIG